MKNIINYYYNLIPKEIYKKKEDYYFFINSVRYTFIKYKGEIDKLFEIYNKHIEILNNNIYVHPIVLNVENKPYTKINNDIFVLMQTFYYGEKITLDNLKTFSILPSKKKQNSWANLWSQKNDYLEYQIKELEIKYPLLKKSFSYFLYLGETAISLINTYQKEEVPYVYAHKRISKNSTTFDLYNPFNIIEDSRVRDPAEYFKQNFFKGDNIENELYRYLRENNLSKYEYIMFFSRMLYPTYYFDIYEKVITQKIDENKINNIINKIDNYEIILKKIYSYYRSFMNIDHIEWLDY